jgi:hypothetical protein
VQKLPKDPELGSDSILRSVAAVGAQAWAVGGNDESQPLLLHWDGTSWTRVNFPFRGALSGVVALAPNNVWVVGDRENDTGPPYVSSLILHYDGHKWARVPSPNPDRQNYLNSITVVSATSLWAVGSERHRVPGHKFLTATHALVEHYNGSRWSVSASAAHLGELSSVTPFRHHLIAVDGGTRTLIAHCCF